MHRPPAHLLRRCCSGGCGPPPGAGGRLLLARGAAWGFRSSGGGHRSSSSASSAGPAPARRFASSAATAAGGGPSQQQQQQQQQQQPAPPEPQAPPAAAYIHLPFCKRKCFYCDFPVEAVGANPGKDRVQSRMGSYVDVLLRELAASPALNDPHAQPLTTVYFGGGTPSLLPPPLLARVLGALRARFGLAPGAEVTIEADPGTFDGALLAEYRRLGFTRLSVGVQSFDEELLRTCGRAHTLPEAEAALAAVAASGFPSWSLDLMSGLPGLTRAGWRAALRRAVATGAPHISVYDLQIEEGTPFARRYAPGAAPLPPDDDAASMYADASEALSEAGYEHYEVSNYAKKGHRSRHNQVYWRGVQYYAFGLGAASYLGGRRYSRPKGMADYEAWVGRYEAAAAAAAAAGEGGGEAALPGAELAPESQDERLLDAVMLGLRTADGLDLARVASDHGRHAVEKMLPALRRREAQGLVLLTPASPGAAAYAAAAGNGGGRSGGSRDPAAAAAVELPARARLTDPQGFLLSNDIISDLFAAL